MKKAKHRIYKRIQWLSSCISITLVLVLLGMVVLFGLSANELQSTVKENLTVTLLLDDDVDSVAASTLMTRLDSQTFVHEMLLITAEEALQEETERMGTDPSRFLNGKNPYTASIEMNVESDYACTDSLIWIADSLKKEAGVVDVVYQQDLVDNLNRTLQKAMVVLTALAVLLMIISVVLINNTVRLNIYARRFVIHTMRLVGASWSFIREPFLKSSMGIALTSAVAANVILLGIVRWVVVQDAFVATVFTTQNVCWMVVTVFVSSFVLTLACTWISVGIFLRMKENEMYQ